MSLTGHCLCGAVEVRTTRHAPDARVSVCHCDLCRIWNGGMQAGFAMPAADVTVTGSVACYRSSSFAERAWCPKCGTHLWLRDDDGPYEFLPGLFSGARDYPLDREVYADRAMGAFRFAGAHARISRASYEQSHPHVEGDTP